MRTKLPRSRARFVFILLWAVLIASAIWHYDDWSAIIAMSITGYLWTGICFCGLCRVFSLRLILLWLPLLFAAGETGD
jgi:hypothetical protein